MKKYTHKDVRELSKGIYPIEYLYYSKIYRGVMYCWIDGDPCFMLYCPDYDGLDEYGYYWGLKEAFPEARIFVGSHYKNFHDSSYIITLLNNGKLKILNFTDIWEEKRKSGR